MAGFGGRAPLSDFVGTNGVAAQVGQTGRIIDWTGETIGTQDNGEPLIDATSIEVELEGGNTVTVPTYGYGYVTPETGIVCRAWNCKRS